jgi:predicted flap endonuclease-1-like 5' DNA nuclease
VFSPSLSRRSGEGEEAAPPASTVHTYLVAAPAPPQLLTATASDGTAEAEVLPFADSLPETESGDDDLTRINGIGKKSAEALKAAGIDTFQKLAATTEDTIRAAFSDAGVRLVGDVDTWAQQAAYAARGDWDGLGSFVAERRAASED